VVNRGEWELRGSDGFAETSGKWVFKSERKEQEARAWCIAGVDIGNC
jgi:hypothetical protein